MIFDGRSSTPVVEKHCSRPSGGGGGAGGGGGGGGGGGAKVKN